MGDKPLFDAFENESIGSELDVIQGIATADNNHFLRLWYEVGYENIGFNFGVNDHITPDLKWFPLNKGGSFNKWYGNHDYIINWQNNGKELKSFKKANVSNTNFYFREFISWTSISMGEVSFRYFPKGFIPDHASGSIYFIDDFKYLLGFLNSSVSTEILKILSPTINFLVGEISKLPIIKNNEYENEIII